MDACPSQVEFSKHGHAYMTSTLSGNRSYSAPESGKADDQCCEKSNVSNFAATDSLKVVDHVSELHDMSAKSVPKSTDSTKNSKVNK